MSMVQEIESKVDSCCDTKLYRVKKRHAVVTAYTYEGTKLLHHYAKLCRQCKAHFYHGYKTIENTIYYDDNVLQNELIVTKQQTAFQTQFLYETILSIFFGHSTFLSICQVYNAKHSPLPSHSPVVKTENDRAELCYKRVAEAVFLFAMLDLKKRFNIQMDFDGDIDITIIKYFDSIQSYFEKKWANHKCSKPGCGSCLVLDGDLKLTRKLCGAKMAGQFSFKNTPHKVLTGCLNLPVPGQPFCKDHKTGNNPSIPKESLPKAIVKKMHDTRSKRRNELLNDDVFSIRGLHGVRTNSKTNDTEYFVSWEGYPEDEKSWVSQKNIPKFIIDFYLETKQETIPPPRIKHVKKSGYQQYGLLTWDGQGPADSYVKIQDLILPEEQERHTSCNTEKHFGRRFYRHSAGIFIGAFPCGVIPLYAELFGSESLTQVHGLVVDFIATTKVKLSTIIYDDACHMVKFCRGSDKKLKINRMDYSEASKILGSLNFYVDRLHIRNHTDPWCHKNCTPFGKKSLDGINSIVAEQTFSWMNKFSQSKGMNRARFSLFLLYILDLHNLNKEGKFYETRPDFIPIEKKVTNDGNKVNYDSANANTGIVGDDKVTADKNGNTSTTMVDDGNKDKNGNGFDNAAIGKICQQLSVTNLNEFEFHCKECNKVFKTERGLKQHNNKIHNVQSNSKSHKCDVCGAQFSTGSNLNRHTSRSHR